MTASSTAAKVRIKTGTSENAGYVYIRKARARRRTDDNAFELEEAEARFVDTAAMAPQRIYKFTPPSPVWLANQSGLRAWLAEER